MRPLRTRRANAIITVRLCAEIYYPGPFVSESKTKQVSGIFPKKLASRLDKNAYGFRYVEMTFASIKGETTNPVLIKSEHKSKTYYIGKELTLDEVKKLTPPERYRILVSNMEINDWDKVVQCRTGNFQPIKKGDVVLPPKE